MNFCVKGWVRAPDNVWIIKMMINGGIRIVAARTPHPALEELLSDVLELVTKISWNQQNSEDKEIGSCFIWQFCSFSAFLSHTHRGAVAQYSLAASSGMYHYKTFGHIWVLLSLFSFGHHRGTSASHLILEYITDRAKQFLLFYVKGSSWKSCVFSGICMMEYSSVQIAVYIYINKYLWSQLQGFDAKILFLGRGENFKK